MIHSYNVKYNQTTTNIQQAGQQLMNICNVGNHSSKAGRTSTDKIGVGAGADIGGTGISCNFMAR
jgi:hypothetical protein